MARDRERERERLTTREFEAIRVDPAEAEAKIGRILSRLQVLAVIVSLLIVAGVIATLAYTVQTLRLLEAETGPAAQARSEVRIGEILEAVDCDRQDDLEVAANVIAELTTEDEADRFRIRFRDRCPRRDLPSPLTTDYPEE